MKVTIYGYKESYLFTQSVKVYLGDRCLGVVKPKGVLVLEGIEENAVLRFKATIIGSTECVVSGSAIVLSYNRLSGFEALATDHADQAMMLNSSKDNNNIIILIAFIVVIIFLVALCF